LQPLHALKGVSPSFVCFTATNTDLFNSFIFIKKICIACSFLIHWD
jgi:hypothetical protein